MSSKALLAAGAAVVLIGAGVAVRTLTQDPPKRVDRQPKVEEVEERLEDPTGLNRRGTAAFVSVIGSEQREEAQTQLKVGRAVTMTSASRTEDFEFQKERAYGPRSISGMVRTRRAIRTPDGPQGRGRGGEVQPVAGATIELYENDPDTNNPPLRTAVADEEGSFTITEINDRAMTYIAIARKDGFAPAVQRLTLQETTPRLFFFMTTGTQVAGLVLDAETSEPIAGARVSFPTSEEPLRMLGETLTNSAGQWAFDNVAGGTVVARAWKDGYSDGSARGRAGRDQIVIRLEQGGGVIRGVGLRRATKSPATGARISVILADGTRRSVLTNDNGQFEFRNLPAGRHSVYGTRRGIESKRTEVSLERGAVVENVVVTLPDDLMVQGRVVKAPSDTAFPGVRIRFRGERGQESVLSDQDGSFAFEVASLENYEIEVREKGWEAEIVSADRRDNGSTGVIAPDRLIRELPDLASASDRLLIRMKPTDTIEGRVFIEQPNRPGMSMEEGSNRSPARFANVTIDAKVGDAMQRVVTRTDQDGIFFVNMAELGGNRAGDARVLASWGGSVGAANVRTNASEPVEIVLRQTRLQGRLELSDGEPLSDVRVEIRSYVRRNNPGGKDNAALPPAVQYTRNRGDFVVGLVPDQPYTFSFELPDGLKIDKTFAQGSELLPRALFIYDPVVSDILVVRDAGSNRRGGQRNSENAQGGRGTGAESGEARQGEGRGRNSAGSVAGGAGENGGNRRSGSEGGPGGMGGGRGGPRGMVNP